MKLRLVAVCLLLLPAVIALDQLGAEPGARSGSDVFITGVYGDIPQPLQNEEATGEELGINAVFLSERKVTDARLQRLEKAGVQAFGEFNSMHDEDWIEEHPESQPVGPDGNTLEPPHGWQGVCPTHDGYREHRMAAFRTMAARAHLDGIWLDYHHAQASWERPEPVFQDSCYCDRCLSRFSETTGVELPEDRDEAVEWLQSSGNKAWVRWRADVYTNWVAEYRQILDEENPGAILGSFHAPFLAGEHGGARLAKLAIDLPAQAAHLDVLSPMLYHVRFGHGDEASWISDQLVSLQAELAEASVERPLWPIVQISNWGGDVSPDDVEAIVAAVATQADGVIAFKQRGIDRDPEKRDALVTAFRTLHQKSP